MNQSDSAEVQNHPKASDGWKMQKPGEPLGLFLLRNTVVSQFEIGDRDGQRGVGPDRETTRQNGAFLA